jgi:DNA invertase Pin-like site-specific DNA recombinase
MLTVQRIPAAQYLRMSTEHQQYSLENQSVAIERYADAHGFDVVKTYSDAGRTGLILRNRAGLQQLLHDVVGGPVLFKAILVYDVSRWGRFQDTDESAHYEFLCRSAGVPIHYCAETFANDNTMPSLIMKALKRTMAGEYSRELGVKVLAGQRRLAGLGFRIGARPGYGLRRMLVSDTGRQKQQLARGERKSIATDRVILVPGPPSEVAVVREIYRLLLEDGMNVNSIARDLNDRGVKYAGNLKWDLYKVESVLTHPKYIGCNVFCRTSRKLRTPLVRLPISDWVVKHRAFEPIIDESTFLAAQKHLVERTARRSDESLLDALRRLLAVEGHLSVHNIRACKYTASPSTYKSRFGGLRKAFKLVGYGTPARFEPSDLRVRTQKLRKQLMTRIVELSGGKVSIVSKRFNCRSLLKLSNRRIISVLVARVMHTWKDNIRWALAPIADERRFVTLLARLNERNDAFLDFYVFGSMQMDTERKFICQADPFLRRGQRLRDLGCLFHVASQAANSRDLGDISIF